MMSSLIQNDVGYRSAYTGIFSHFGLINPEPSDPDVFLWGAEILEDAHRPQRLVLGGAGFTKQAAMAACLGEAIERFACYPIPSDEVITSSYRDFPKDLTAIHPKHWALFHSIQYRAIQFPFIPLSEHVVCDWVCFRTLESGSAVFVPQEFAYLYPPALGVHQFSPAVSTGLACGKHSDPVLLRALQEVIERDALMGSFFERYPLLEHSQSLVCSSLPKEKIDRILRPHLTYRFYQVKSPHSQNVTIVTLSGQTRVGFCRSVGSACRETLAQSFEKSIIEAIQGWHYVRYLKSEIKDGRRSFSGDCHDFADHALYHSIFQDRWKETVFEKKNTQMTSEISAQEHGSKEESLQVLLHHFGNKHPILFRNVTPPEVVQRQTGDYVLKVVVPGLQPMHGNDHFPHLGGSFWGETPIEEFAKFPPHPFP